MNIMKLKYSKDKETTRDLTPHEEVFLQGLAEYKLFLDKSLFFQIDDLQKHTELVLSGETETAYRYEFSNPDELNKEIEELEKLIKDLVDKLEKGVLPQECWALLEEYKKRLKKLKEAREEMTEDPDKKKKASSFTKIYKISLLGKYEHKHGDDSRVTLYVKNIEACAKNPYDTMLLMGQVLLHEYFHSFYYHVGVGSKERIKYVEEPMAEFGSLVVLDSVASSGLPISIYADHALKYGLAFVKKKQSREGLSAAYGFGAYIFDKHKDDYYDLIPGYANVSHLLDKSDRRVLEYKYLVYPEYPFMLETVAYKLLRDIIISGEHCPSTKVAKTVSSTTGLKIGELARREFTARIPSFSKDILNKLQDVAYCKEEFGLNYPVLSKKLIKTSKKNRYYVPPVGEYYICSEWYDRHKERLEDWLSRHKKSKHCV